MCGYCKLQKGGCTHSGKFVGGYKSFLPLLAIIATYLDPDYPIDEIVERSLPSWFLPLSQELMEKPYAYEAKKIPDTVKNEARPDNIMNVFFNIMAKESESAHAELDRVYRPIRAQMEARLRDLGVDISASTIPPASTIASPMVPNALTTVSMSREALQNPTHSPLQIRSASHAGHRLSPSHVESEALMSANSRGSFDFPTPSTHIPSCNKGKARATDTDVQPDVQPEAMQADVLETFGGHGTLSLHTHKLLWCLTLTGIMTQVPAKIVLDFSFSRRCYRTLWEMRIIRSSMNSESSLGMPSTPA